MNAPTPPWWQTAIIYQLYPLSFQDSNGDGMGDLPGILGRLDYLASLNISAVWLSPIFPSPMRDFGYDVADYTGVHPWFGTLSDFDRLLKGLHSHGMKLILDLVPNHTSDQHPWFLESRRSRINLKRDWYLWRDPAPGGGPPNNWLSFFGGPAWSFDKVTGQYYLHQFTPEQPELNLRQAAVLGALLDAMRFWLDRGVDGFRVDVPWLLIKDAEFRDEPENPNWDGIDPHGRLLHNRTAHQPELHAIVRAMRTVTDSYPGDRVLIGETNVPDDELVQYYGTARDEFHLPFNFRLIYARWDAREIRRLIETYEAILPQDAWPNWVLGNHDQPRIASRAGADQARVAAMLLLTLRGTPSCYYGDELGMENVTVPRERMRDPQALRQPEAAGVFNRDSARTPLPWDGLANAGFTREGVEPWLPLGGDGPIRNVARQSEDSQSMLAFFRTVTSLRQRHPALNRGDYESVETAADGIFAYTRAAGGQRILIVLNFACCEHLLDLSELADGAEILLSTGMQRTGRVELRRLRVLANEGLVLHL
ncbi:MAG: alpha-amylase family glycosyl hydrolase [Methylococcus sp.]|nr:alpha-amylase family glycosyl hydrolase [Methylococcus sp.]